MEKPRIKSGHADKALLLINTAMALLYFSWWFHRQNIDNPYLYFLLFIGEVYHVLMTLIFWQTLWPGRLKRKTSLTFTDSSQPTIDVFITVAGEPTEVVRETAIAARDMDYENHRIYILNDGYVAKKENWQEIEDLANELGIYCITRKIPGGAKAGNVNNGVKETRGELVVVFDADMVPHSDFLKKIVPYFNDTDVGFVQSPQYYKNFATNRITSGAWNQQRLFFGPIMIGKEKSNAAFICGTNFAIRRKVLVEVGGLNEENIAEDFLTSLAVHQKGWKSYYIDEVLSEGLAPEDMMSYYKQQLRWARGSLEVLFSMNPLFKKGLSWDQKIQYLSSALYYFNGVIVLIDMIMPILFLYLGIRPVAATSTSFAIYFLPFMFLSLYTLYKVAGEQLSFEIIAFSQSSWTLQLLAIKSVLLKQKMAFAVTPKQALSGNFINLAYPHIIYIILVIIGIPFGLAREGLNSSVITNIAWALVNGVTFLPFVIAAYKADWKKEEKLNKGLTLVYGNTV